MLSRDPQDVREGSGQRLCPRSTGETPPYSKEKIKENEKEHGEGPDPNSNGAQQRKKQTDFSQSESMRELGGVLSLN